MSAAAGGNTDLLTFTRRNEASGCTLMPMKPLGLEAMSCPRAGRWRRWPRLRGPAAIAALVAACACLGPARHAAGADPTSAKPAGADPTSAKPAERNKAQTLFKKGRDFFVVQKYEQALEEFEASLEIVASPNTRLYVARCLREMGKLKDAHAEFGRVEADANRLAERDARYGPTAQTAAEERAELGGKLAFITFKVNHPADNTTVKVDGQVVPPSTWQEPMVLVPGTIEVTLETPPAPPSRQTLTIAAGETKTLELDLAPESPPPAPPEVAPAPPPDAPARLRPLAYVAGGIGAAGVVTFVFAGAMANSSYAALKNACNDGPCPPWKADDVSAGRTQQTIANVGLVLGIVGIAAGTTLFVLSEPKGTASQTSLVVGPTWLGVRGEM